jgi:hypothetical protein
LVAVVLARTTQELHLLEQVLVVLVAIAIYIQAVQAQVQLVTQQVQVAVVLAILVMVVTHQALQAALVETVAVAVAQQPTQVHQVLAVTA